MTDYTPAPLDPEWLAMREELHAQYESMVGLDDASRLGFLYGENRVWTDEQIAEVWREAANNEDRRKDAINHVYVHVPYCKSICSFCNYQRLRPTRADEMERYVERILHSLNTIAPAVEPMRWHTLYFGGGTPSTLPAHQLRRIVSALDERLRWHPDSTRFFEFDPAVFNKAKLDVLLEAGFEHFSFGVQTLQADVNADHNRGAQSADMVQRRFEELQGAGVFNISCDFLLGLLGTTPEQILQEIDEVLALRPRWVDLFFLTPTDAYVNSHFGGDREAFWKHIKPFHDMVPDMARTVAARRGYRMRRGHGHNIILYRAMQAHERTKKNGIFSYTQLVDQQRRPLHLLGFGVSARNKIFGEATFECADPEDVLDPGGVNHWVGNHHGMEGEVRKFLAHFMRDNHRINREMFQRIFQVDITEAIPGPLSAWVANDVARVLPEEVQFRKQGRRDRTRTLLWMVPDAQITWEVQRYLRNQEAQQRKREADARRESHA